MALTRCLLNTTRTYVSRNMLQTKVRPSYCILRHNYSSSERKYTDRHEWVVVDNGVGTVGISSYAQESLGDVVFAQLPDEGAKFEIGEECGALESVKAASEIYCPLSGTIAKKNVAVEEKPSLINTSCYRDGWLFKIKLTNVEEINELMNETQYKIFLKTDIEKQGN